MEKIEMGFMDSDAVITGSVPDMTDAPDLPPPAQEVVVQDITTGYVTAEQVSAAIERVVKFNAKNNEAIQRVLVMCCAIAFDVERHKKNVAPFTTLIKGLRGTERQTMINWIEAHAPAIWRKDEASNKRFVFNNSFKGAYNYKALMEDKWYDQVKPEKELSSSIDFREQLDNLVKRLTREAQATGDKRKDITNPEVLTELKALQGRLSAAEYN
jgi:hypothetical protein